MKIEEIKEIAKQYNIKAGKLKKVELIRAIQETEKNGPCFETGQKDVCGQDKCTWRSDCS